MKLHSATVYCIAIFVAALVAALQAEDAKAEVRPFIEVGTTIYELQATQGAVGLTWNDKYEISRKFVGRGENKYGHHTPQAKIWNVDRLIYPGWFNNSTFMLIGISKIDVSNLVGTYNYHLGAGYKWNTGKLYLEHYSSADINEQNTGVNMITLRLDL